MAQGIQPGTNEWFRAMRMYYANDSVVMQLMDYLKVAYEELQALKETNSGRKAAAEVTTASDAQDDEWSTGG